MKKRLLSLCCILILIVGITAMPVFDSHAASELPMIDGSYLTYDDESVGYDTIQLVVISRPSAYGEYEPYRFVNTEYEFETAVKNM